MQLIKRAGLDQAKLARAFGVNRQTVVAWVHGRATPQLYPAETQQLCRILNCSLDELVQAFDPQTTTEAKNEN